MRTLRPFRRLLRRRRKGRAVPQHSLLLDDGTPVELNVPYPLAFTGENGCHVDHGHFWAHDTGTNLGASFFWEAWVKPLGTGYVVSDGYGGAHALLWGFTGSPGGPYVAVGNVWNGGTVPVPALHEFRHGEWCHIAIGLAGGKLYTWANGVGDAFNSFAGTRQTHTSGGGKLYVGGSDHLNFTGRIAALRGWDRGELVPNVNESFCPERSWLIGYSAASPASFAASYLNPFDGIIADHSAGVVSFTDGAKVTHPGRRLGTADYASAYLGGPQIASAPTTIGPMPAHVRDDDCPFGRRLGTTAAPASVRQNPPPTPAGARIFDSFSRADQTCAFHALPSLGSTEAGSLGPRPWTSGTPGVPLFGILGGRAVFLGASGLGNGFRRPAWVENGSADMDVRVTRRLATNSGTSTGLVFRLTDADNYWFVWVGADGVTGFLGSYTAGAEDNGTTIWSAGSDAQIRAVASGTTITVYTGDGSNWTQREQRTNQTKHQAATKAGIMGPHSSAYTGLATFSRWDDFTVLAA